MEDYRVNINYAKALFLIATDKQQQDEVLADMRLVHQVCAENRELNVVFNNPVIKESKKVAVLNDLFEDKVSQVSQLFLSFVVKKRRTVNLRGISSAYMDLYRDAHNIVRSELVTAIEVEPEAKELVKKVIGDYTRKQVELEARTDDKMLGGFCMSFDNNMYDARLRTKVSKLRKEFRKNIYESKL
jgi:F-type H+-transporting ATPase subunit delta